MQLITLPFSERRLSFFLAMEEYLARHVHEDDLFIMWQVRPSVIFGRHQVMENEVNMGFCREHNIEVYRRKSGGGCVYADMDNVMMSYITSGDDVQFVFHRFMNMLVFLLRKLGVEATVSGRNDVMIGDRKVSGTAFYHLPGRCIVHGTMLYDTNIEYMMGAITPSKEKMASKGIQSVRQRITLLKDHIDLTLEEFKTFVAHALCDGERPLTSSEIAGIEELEQTYLDKEFITRLTI